MKFSENKKIAIFCGSSVGSADVYAKTAITLIDVMYNAGFDLIYGGAKVGIMGVIGKRMLSNGGKAIGVMPKSLVDVEIADQNISELIVVNSMHERKQKISSLADGFILLPGGSGSLEEFFEVYTWAQLGYHNKPCSILNIDGYYDHLLKFLDHSVTQGFMKSMYRNMIIVSSSPHELIQKILSYQPPAEKKWLAESLPQN